MQQETNGGTVGNATDPHVHIDVFSRLMRDNGQMEYTSKKIEYVQDFISAISVMASNPFFTSNYGISNSKIAKSYLHILLILRQERLQILHEMSRAVADSSGRQNETTLLVRVFDLPMKPSNSQTPSPWYPRHLPFSSSGPFC